MLRPSIITGGPSHPFLPGNYKGLGSSVPGTGDKDQLCVSYYITISPCTHSPHDVGSLESSYRFEDPVFSKSCRAVWESSRFLTDSLCVPGSVSPPEAVR